jgi:small subunit ribosomal protein S6
VPTYETLFITPPTLSDEEEKAAVATLAEIVTERGGTFTTNERMGRRRLAYPIRKFEDGVYTRFLYDAATEVPHELERRLRLSDQVLRSLTIRMEPDWAEASKIQAVKDIERRAEMEIEAARQAEEEAKRAAEAAEAAAAAPAVEDAEEPVAAAPEAAVSEAPAEPAEPAEKED